MRRLVALLGFVVIGGMTTNVDAAQDEFVIAAEPGYALLTTEAASQHGASYGASAWLGLSDDLWLAFSAGGGYATASEGVESVSYVEGFGGLVAALDVFRTIPFIEAQIGAVITGDSASPTVRIGVGIDYFLARTISVGAVVRLRPVDEAIGTSIFSASARLAWRIEL